MAVVRRWLPVLALLLLVAGSAWLIRELERASLRGAEEAPHVPDFYMENFTTTTMNEQGRPRRRLQARYMEHFPDTDTNELREPYMILYDPGHPPWHVRSERGWTSSGGDVMLLLGEVHIWRDDAAGTRVIDVHTRDLRVLPASDYGETDKKVVIRTPNSETEGVGMRAYLDESRLELLAGVRTRYETRTD